MEDSSKDKFKSPVSGFADGYEICGVCGKKTDIKVTTPVTERKYYVYGSGQCCEKCWRELYGRTGESGDSAI